MEDKVSATPAALLLIEEIVREHGPVLFHQSGGCCDGSSPMCYPQNEFIIGDTDVLLGHIGGAPVYISASQFEAWKHTDLIIDVVPGRGGMLGGVVELEAAQNSPGFGGRECLNRRRRPSGSTGSTGCPGRPGCTRHRDSGHRQARACTGHSRLPPAAR